MTQTFVDRYMEDDVIYKMIGLVRDNLRFIVAFFVTGLVTFYSGKIYGVRTHSVISGLKERYANIEHKKKKLRRQIELLGAYDKVSKKLIILCFIIQVGLIINVILHRGFDYNILFTNSISRNTIFLLFAVLIIIMITRRALRKLKTSKLLYLSTIHSGMDEIAGRLLESLGPELTTILKMKLMTKSVNTVTLGTQTVRAPKPKPEVVINPAEMEVLKKRLLELEAINHSGMAVIENEEIEKQILKRDLKRHKVFLQKLKAFEWCEKCLAHADQGEEEEEEQIEAEKEGKEGNEEKGDKVEEREAPEKTHPANHENKDEIEVAKQAEEAKKEEIKEEIEKGGEKVKVECENECLKRYFEMGFAMSNQFNHAEEEIVELKRRYAGKIGRSKTSV